MIHAVVSHGYGLCADVAPEHDDGEGALYAVDELTGLIGAAALMRPSKSVQDMELKSLKKKYQGQKICCWLQSGYHCKRCGPAGLGAGRASG